MQTTTQEINHFDNHTVKSSPTPVPTAKRNYIAYIKNNGTYYVADLEIERDQEYGWSITATNVLKFMNGKSHPIKDLSVSGLNSREEAYSEFWARWAIYSRKVNGFKAFLEIKHVINN